MTMSGSSAIKARQPEATIGWSSTIRTRIANSTEAHHPAIEALCRTDENTVPFN
jgi:hypothetical protein